jgi:hypothetical protein
MVSFSDYEEALLEMGYTYDDVRELGSEAKNDGNTLALGRLYDIAAELGMIETAGSFDDYWNDSIGFWQNYFWYEEGITADYDEICERYKDTETGKFLPNPYYPLYTSATRFTKL